MAEVFQYLELWSKLEAEGGTRIGFLGTPIGARRRRRLNGDDSLSFSIAKTHRLASSIERGKVIREVLSLDGTSVREWVIATYSWASGTELLMNVECISPFLLLANYPITSVDGDGFVYQDAAAILLAPGTIVGSFILSNTPAYVGAGTITPTALAEAPFSGDSALSGLRRLEEVVPGYEASYRRNGASQYLIDFSVLGGSAPTLYLRTMKNLRSLRKEVVQGQVTRVNQIAGPDGDDGPSGIAWAYWEVEATSGSGPYRVKLKAIHGGAGPIKYDDQLNHSGLPGGSNSLYLEKANGTYIQITDSFAGSTQEVEVSSLTGISVGDWVRIVASSTGKHLTSLDAPNEISSYGIHGGRFESAWDDTVCVLKNALQSTWPSTLPTGWTGLGAKTTAANEWLTSGQAILINQSVSDAAQISAPPARTWYIRNRRTIWSAVAWIKLKAAISAGDITFRVKVGSTVIGSGLVYMSPYGAWRQLKIEGIDLSAYVGTSVSLTAEIVKSGGTGSVNMIVDSICLFPSLSARAVTEGSNAARTWQGVNQFLDDSRTVQVSYKASIADLARMGLTNQQDVAIGGTAIIADDELGTVSARIVEIEDDPADTRDTQVSISTLPPRLTRQQSKPLALVIPYEEPIQVRVADRDTRNAALLLKAQVTASDAASVTITLTAQDSLGGTPTISYLAFGASYSSGSGVGPYVFLRPGVGAGTGRVLFTAKLAGRNDVYDAVDIAEVDPTSLPQMVAKAVTQSSTPTQLVVRISAATGSAGVSVTATHEDGAASVSLTAGATPFSSIAAIDDTPAGGSYAEYTITRPAFQAGAAHVIFKLTATGYRGATVSVAVADQDRDTVTLQLRARVTAQTATTVTVRVAGVDPFPQGANSLSIAHQAQGVTSVDLTSPQTITPEATFSEAANTYKDYVITRAAAGGGTGRVTFTGTATGRVAASDAVDVPCQDLAPPSLQLTYTEVSDTQGKFVWTSTGTVEVSKNNGTWTAPGSLTPAITTDTAFNRPDTDDVYAWRCVNNGITISEVVLVKAKVYSPTLTIAQPQKNSASSIDVKFTVSGVPTGTTVDVEYMAYSSSNVATGAFGSSYDQSITVGSEKTINFDPNPDLVDGDKWRVSVKAKFGGVVLIAKERYTSVLL